ncbi:hypothetical protein [Saccharothrix lopnurensis]|uniref:Uncharacterized protein n=1 Tax=Saccharothrix lopnurensis TaxID=1670621 RepID=A0ABW1PH43_9PSEU
MPHPVARRAFLRASAPGRGGATFPDEVWAAADVDAVARTARRASCAR